MPRALRSGWTQAAGHLPPLPAGLDAAGQQAFYQTQLANPNSPLNISTLDKDPKLTFYSSAGPVQKRRAEKAYFRTNRLRARVSSNYVRMSSLKFNPPQCFHVPSFDLVILYYWTHTLQYARTNRYHRVIGLGFSARNLLRILHLMTLDNVSTVRLPQDYLGME